MKNYIVITIVALLILSITTHANAEGLLRKNGRKEKQKQLPLEKEHGVSHEVTKHENHEQLASDLNAKNRNTTMQAEADRKKAEEEEARRNATRRAKAALSGEEEDDDDSTAKCELVKNLPCGGKKGGKSYMSSYNNTLYTVDQYRKAMNEFYGLLPVLSVFHSLDMMDQFPPPLEKCLDGFKAETCNVIFPKCNDKCEAQKPCHSSCTSFGKCSAWFTPSLLSNMQKGGDHFNIVEGVVKDQNLLNIISDIVDTFTSKCTSITLCGNILNQIIS